MRVYGMIGALFLLGACADPGPLLPDKLVLSPNDARHLWPSYSPDGSRVAYWAPAATGIGSQLWVADADLRNATMLPATTLFGGDGALWSPDGTQLAVVSSDFGTADVVVVPASGGAVTRLTKADGVELPLDWFPDGDRIAYVASVAGGSFTTSVVSLSRGELGPLIPGERRTHVGSPSPDGQHIGFLVIDGPRTTIWVADSSGRSPRALTTEGFESMTTNRIGWSPDSKEILYLSRRTGTTDLWVAPIDGSAPRQLTRDLRNDYAEAWSPDGQFVAFASDRGKQTDLWVVPAAGGEELRITDDVEDELGPLAWRPGREILTYTVSTTTAGIVAMDLADGVERRLTPDSIRAAGFWLSPAGNDYLYRVIHGGDSRELILAPLSGGSGRVIVERGGSINNVAISPDGSKLAYDSNRNGTLDIWTADVAGSAPRVLANWSTSDERQPEFTGDGGSVAFVSNRESSLNDLWRVSAAGGEPTRVTRGVTINDVQRGPGSGALFVSTLGQRAGQFGVGLVGANGTIQTVWDRSNVLNFSVTPAGDSVAAMVEQPDGSNRTMFLSAKGTGGRPILEPGDVPGVWSLDGKAMLFSRNVNGAFDVFSWDRTSGAMRQVTKTPEDEGGTEYTQDGKSVVFQRTKIVQRLYAAELSSLLAVRP